MLPVTQSSETSFFEEKNDKDGIENCTDEEQDANDYIQNNEDKKTSLEIICMCDKCVSSQIHYLKLS